MGLLDGDEIDIGAMIIDLGRRGHAAYVLLAAAKLNDAIETLLVGGMPQLSNTLRAKLFRGYSAPMESFATKIDLSFALGLIGESIRRDLHAFRDIRNAFAHPTGPTHLDTDEMLTLLRKFPDYDDENGKMVRMAFIQAKFSYLLGVVHGLTGESAASDTSPETSE